MFGILLQVYLLSGQSYYWQKNDQAQIPGTEEFSLGDGSSAILESWNSVLKSSYSRTANKRLASYCAYSRCKLRTAKSVFLTEARPATRDRVVYVCATFTGSKCWWLLVDANSLSDPEGELRSILEQLNLRVDWGRLREQKPPPLAPSIFQKGSVKLTLPKGWYDITTTLGGPPATHTGFYVFEGKAGSVDLNVVSKKANSTRLKRDRMSLGAESRAVTTVQLPASVLVIKESARSSKEFHESVLRLARYLRLELAHSKKRSPPGGRGK